MLRGFAIGALGTLMLLCGSASAQSLAVIVNPERGSSITEEDLRLIYLKQRRFWKEGGRIVPINRNADSAARKAFQAILFELTEQQLGLYWNRQYFRGVLPPATLASDEAVLRFVASEPRAIGYVDAAAADGSVKVILYVGDEKSSPVQSPPDQISAPPKANATTRPVE